MHSYSKNGDSIFFRIMTRNCQIIVRHNPRDHTTTTTTNNNNNNNKQTKITIIIQNLFIKMPNQEASGQRQKQHNVTTEMTEESKQFV